MPDGTEETMKRFEKELNEMSKESEEDKAKRLEELGRITEALKQPNPNISQPDKPPRQEADISTNILRQKIEGLRHRVALGGFEKYNKAIDDVLAILNEAMAEKELPDEQGWWWNTQCKRYFEVNSDLMVQYYCNARIPALSIQGKWVKAIMPE